MQVAIGLTVSLFFLILIIGVFIENYFDSKTASRIYFAVIFLVCIMIGYKISVRKLGLKKKGNKSIFGGNQQ